MLQNLRNPLTYEDLLKEVEYSPFSQAAVDTALPPKFHRPTFSKFDDMIDPHEHVCQYQQVILGTTMLKESKDAIICKLFPQSLKGSALKWFCQLASGLVGTFKEMTKVFLENYSANIDKGTTPDELYTIIQQPSE